MDENEDIPVAEDSEDWELEPWFNPFDEDDGVD